MITTLCSEAVDGEHDWQRTGYVLDSLPQQFGEVCMRCGGQQMVRDEPTTTGGTLTVASYAYKVTALGGHGEAVPL